MKNFQEFINKQQIALDIKNESFNYINNSSKEYEKNFYFTHESSRSVIDGSLVEFEMNFNFFLPDMNVENPSLQKISISGKAVYTLSKYKFDMESFEVNILEEEVDPFYAFFLAHVNDLNKDIINHLYNTFAEDHSVSQETFRDMKHLYDVKRLNLHKIDSHEMKFPEFLVEMNQKYIQNVLAQPMIIKKSQGNIPQIVLGEEEAKIIKESFDRVFDKFLGSIQTKKDFEIKAINFDNIIKIIGKHDILNNHTKLVKALPEKPNKKTNKKI